MNTCDYDHQTKNEIRVLPIGGSGNILCCHRHYLEEMKARFEWITEDGREFDIPTWESLEVYAEALT